MAGTDPTGLDAASLARLAILQRLAMGAAHTLNNAFTTIVAEASFLHGDYKHDPVVAEACEAILREIDRCTTINRALLARRSPSQGGSGEVDLARQVRELGNFLPEVLGRQNELRVSYPDDLLLVRGEAARVELLVMALVVYAADQAPHGGVLELRVGPAADGAPHLELEVRGRELPEQVAAALLDPGLAPDPLVRLQLDAIAGLVAGLGGRLESTRLAEGWRLALALPAPGAEPGSGS